MRKTHEQSIMTLTPPTTPEQTGESAPKPAPIIPRMNDNSNLNANNATDNAGELKIDESAVSETGRNVNKNEHKPIRVSVIKRRQIN